MGPEFRFRPNISSSEKKFNDDPKHIRLKSSQLTNEPIWPSRLALEGGGGMLSILSAPYLIIRALLYKID